MNDDDIPQSQIPSGPRQNASDDELSPELAERMVAALRRLGTPAHLIEQAMRGPQP